MKRIYDVKWVSADGEEDCGVIVVAQNEEEALELATAELDDIDDMPEDFKPTIIDKTNDKILGTYYNFIP